MDRQSPERTSHPNTRAERIDLLEVAQDFLGTVEFAADIREASSRYRRSLCLADHPEVGLSMTTSAFVGTNPTDESIVSDLPVVRRLFGNPMLRTLLTQRLPYFEVNGDSCPLWPRS